MLAPVLITSTEVLDPVVDGYITSIAATLVEVHVIGGQRAIAGTVAANLATRVFKVVRHEGADRYATAVDAMAHHFSKGASPNHFVMASGLSFADALVGSVYAGRSTLPMVLTDPSKLPNATGDYLAARADDIDLGTVIGGSKAVSDAVLDYTLLIY